MANEYNYGVIPNTGIAKDQLGDKNYLDGPVLPQGKDGSLSVGGWTDSNRGFSQQTFLGASVRSFNLSAGFGDSSSSMSVDLVNDEYNKSDGTLLGSGDDPYHNGRYDSFQPPVVGAPVFFKFGQNLATVEQAFRKTFDDTYNFKTLEEEELLMVSGLPVADPNYGSGIFTKINFPEGLNGNSEYVYYSGAVPIEQEDGGPSYKNQFIDRTKFYDIDYYEFKNRGKNHFAFGGILQSYVENRGTAGAPLYNAKINDPREILSNVTVLLNNYQGTTFNNKNLINAYGFLEYDPSDQLQAFLDSSFDEKRILEKRVGSEGNVVYQNDDTYYAKSLKYLDKFLPENQKGKVRYTGSFKPTFGKGVFLDDDVDFTKSDYAAVSDLNDIGWMGSDFPITGQGFSRRSEKGIPWHRLSQALATLFNYYGFLPREYHEAGFGGTINFRGYNYVVDFTGLPLHLLPKMYYLDFDQIDLLSLAQEICDITSHDLFVSLLPVIDHPACARYYWRNRWNVEVKGKEEDQIVGVIRLDAINRTKQPRYGAIKEYLDDLEARKVYVSNRDVGYEVSNVTTDKIVVGAQEVEMHYFTNNKDRDELQLRRMKDGLNNHFDYLQTKQWELHTSLSQQILPFYGFLGENAVSIPKGFGAYKQIMIDTQGLDAHGVGNYYIATELELRHASVSYEQWRDFLLQYDEVYLQEVSENQTFWNELTNSIIEDKVVPFKDIFKAQKLKDQLDEIAAKNYAVSVPRCVWDSERNWMGSDGLPASPCNPPYGYPLYYKRAEKIGIPEAGIAEIQGAINSVISNVEKAEELADDRAKYFFDNRDEAMSKINKIRSKLYKTASWQETGGENYSEYVESVNSQLDNIEKVWQQEANGLRSYKNNAISIIKSTRDGNPLTKSVPEIAKKHIKNAKKVHQFLKRLADENLGKKFLVKVPKSCNINYSDKMQYYPDFTQNMATGPFGFKPMPVDTDASYVNSAYFDLELSFLRAALPLNPFFTFHEHYNDYYKLKEAYTAINPKTLQSYQAKKSYTYGALKCNWNTVGEKWDFNYKPEPQGGFFNYALYNQNMSLSESLHIQDSPGELPSAVEQGLVPVDLTNIMVSSNRVSPYVRFDNSQYYDFSQIPPDSFTQQFRDKYNNRLFVPDVSETLDNIQPDKKDFLNESFNDITSQDSMNSRLNRKPESVAFVKCNVNEEFYLTPPIATAKTHIWANDYEVSFAIESPSIVQFEDSSGCLGTAEIGPNIIPIFKVSSDGVNGKSIWNFPTSTLTEEFNTTLKSPAVVSVLTKYGASWKLKSITRSPSQSLGEGFEDVVLERATGVAYLSGTPLPQAELAAGSPTKVKNDLVTFGRRYDRHLDSWMVITEKKLLDPDNVYALISLPGKVIPIAEKRFCDSVLQSYEPVKFKNVMTQDVIRINDFVDPAPKINKQKDISCYSSAFNTLTKDINYENVTSAQKEQQKILRGLSLAKNKINFTAPSPVYPDIVALPLMSMERCYGPWQSASIVNPESDPRERYFDIGGKVEFIKDENLAPWNYAGYQLMNEAGSLQAQLSNSLLLFSERGGFVFADYPSGIGLAKHLLNEGPLVTSITVDVSNNGLRTTVKMDLYTSRFGKMQKQKEMAISQVARERQKIIDRNNAAIRRGLGKGQANMDLYGSVLKNGGQNLLRLAKSDPEEYSTLQRGKLGQKITIMENNIDQTTGEFVKNNIDIHPDDFNELKQLFPNNNDIRRIDMQHYIVENKGEITEYILNGPIGTTNPKTVEAAGEIELGVGWSIPHNDPQNRQYVISAVQDHIGTFL